MRKFLVTVLFCSPNVTFTSPWVKGCKIKLMPEPFYTFAAISAFSFDTLVGLTNCRPPQKLKRLFFQICMEIKFEDLHHAAFWTADLEFIMLC